MLLHPELETLKLTVLVLKVSLSEYVQNVSKFHLSSNELVIETGRLNSEGRKNMVCLVII